MNALSRTMMMSRQETLARLPLPSLEDTLARYLRAATPVVASPAQLQATRALVDEAVQERGLKLSRALTEWSCHTLLTAYVSSDLVAVAASGKKRAARAASRARGA